MVVPLISIILLCPLAAFAIFALLGVSKTEFPTTRHSFNRCNARRAGLFAFAVAGRFALTKPAYPGRRNS